MNGYTLTHVYNIDGKLFIGDSIEKALELARIYSKDHVMTIKSIKLVEGDCFCDSNAVVNEEPSLDQICHSLKEIIGDYITHNDGIDVDKLILDLRKSFNNNSDQ